MTLVSGLTHSADNCASSANRKILKMLLEASCVQRLCTYVLQWNLDLSFFKGMEIKNDECGKTINPENYYTL